jgi:chaperonin cofactor prefoldin
MKEKVADLEKRLSRHDDQIARLFSKMDSTNNHLTDIQKSLDQIKYTGIGALAYYVLSEVGFLEGLKVLS